MNKIITPISILRFLAKMMIYSQRCDAADLFIVTIAEYP